MRPFFQRRTPAPSAHEARDAWLIWFELGGASKRTIEGYRRITDRFLERWPELKLSEFTDEHLVGFIEEASIRSRQQRRGPFANWFAWAHRTRRIEKNPMVHVPTYKQPQQEPVECFTEAEVRNLVALPHPDGTLMAILLGTGIRKAEARHLSVRRIDFDNHELHVVDGAKGGSLGVVPLSAALVHRLADYVLAEKLNPDDYLWYCHPGGSLERKHERPISDGAMQKWWVRAIPANVEYRNMHTTRHTFATIIRRRGLPLDDVSDLLRHADPRTTRRVYTHLKAVDIRERMERLGVEAPV